MVAFAVLLRFVLLYLSAKPTTAMDLWCGKTYKPQDAAIDPGGFIPSPEISRVPLLDLSVRPRMNLYLDEDTTGSVIVDAQISYIVGEHLSGRLARNTTSFFAPDNIGLPIEAAEQLSVTIVRSDTGDILLSNVAIALNSTGNEFRFSLREFATRRLPYDIYITAKRSNGQVSRAKTKLSRLPEPDTSASVSRIDSLYSGILARTGPSKWTTIFPYSFYMAGPWLRESSENMQKFFDYGYNVLHIVPAGGLGYELSELDAWLDEADRIGLWIMLDMRWSYQVPKNTRILVKRAQRHKNLLLWYTADEPDGYTDPRGGTKMAYDLINTLDGYHPVSLCLNCQNFHFQEYTSGADIILADPYPIGNRLDYSEEYHTPCNTTYGDCGCDNCYTTSPSPLLNVPARFDDYRNYQTQLGLDQKPLWAVPQAFGNAQFRKREPTAEELIATTLLSINHGAKGVVMWTWPTSAALADVTSRFAKVATSIGAGFWVGANGRILETKGALSGTVDAAAWVVGQGMLVSVVNVAGVINGRVTVTLPDGVQAKAIRQAAWGSSGWVISGGNQLVRTGIGALESVILVIDVAGGALNEPASGNLTATS